MHVYEIEYKCQINIHETLVTGRPKWEFGLNRNNNFLFCYFFYFLKFFFIYIFIFENGLVFSLKKTPKYK